MDRIATRRFRSRPRSRVVVEAMEQVANGYSVAVVPLEKELTSTQVARLLNVSRPFAARLMDRGEIPSHRVGTHRRVFYADVMAYRRRMDRDADDAFRRMTELSEELGLYDGRGSRRHRTTPTSSLAEERGPVTFRVGDGCVCGRCPHHRTR